MLHVETFLFQIPISKMCVLMFYCTLKHVHHAKEGQWERGFAAARPATDPHLKTNKSESPTFKSWIKHIFWYLRFCLHFEQSLVTFCPGLMCALTFLSTGFSVASYRTLRFWILISPCRGQPSGTWDTAETNTETSFLPLWEAKRITTGAAHNGSN